MLPPSFTSCFSKVSILFGSHPISDSYGWGKTPQIHGIKFFFNKDKHKNTTKNAWFVVKCLQCLQPNWKKWAPGADEHASQWNTRQECQQIAQQTGTSNKPLRLGWLGGLWNFLGLLPHSAPTFMGFNLENKACSTVFHCHLCNAQNLLIQINAADPWALDACLTSKAIVGH